MAAVIDEELLAGLRQAKKSLRNFALILKGTSVVKLIVSKKPIPDGKVMKARTETKGTASCVGTCLGDGTNLVFHVLEEPSAKIPQFREYLSETSGLSLKPSFQVVAALERVDDGDDQTEESETEDGTASAIPEPPAAPPVLSPELAALREAFLKMAPRIPPAIAQDATLQQSLLDASAAFKAGLKAADVDAAKQALLTIAKLLPKASSPSTDAGTGNGAGISLVKLGKVRLEWDTVRRQAIKELQRLKDLLLEEYEGDRNEAAALTAAHQRLDAMVAQMNEELGDRLDDVLNADAAVRPTKAAEAKSVVLRIIDLVDNDDILSVVDGNEYAPDMRVAQPMRSKLQEIVVTLA